MDDLFFSNGAKLHMEYDRLFSSIFGKPEMMKSIVKTLGARSMGYTRSELAERSGYSDGGTLTDALNALIASDFIIKYTPFTYKKREDHYKLVDPFCIFYLRFVDGMDTIKEGFWLENVDTPSIASWRGYAFENVCFCHIDQIKRALLSEFIPKKSTIQNTLITTYGIKHNAYRWAFENVITMDDLFS